MTTAAVCQVPGCANCSQKWAGHEYLCSRHWPLVPSRLKRRRAMVRRRYARRPEQANRLNHLNWVIWRAMVRAAIEAAAGL